MCNVKARRRAVKAAERIRESGPRLQISHIVRYVADVNITCTSAGRNIAGEEVDGHITSRVQQWDCNSSPMSN